MEAPSLLPAPAICERARLARDRRFDGRFFVAVTSTRIFCRVVCPAKSPRADRVRFYPSAAAAAEAGYRPCLRCRPECAPTSSAWSGTAATVKRALLLIAEDGAGEMNLPVLAARLGIGDRHLRRLFQRHLGASPVAVIKTHRLQFAKRLLDDTTLPVARIAAASGYRSLRRLNADFRQIYGRSPSDLRRRGGASGGGLLLHLAYREPFAWDAALEFLAARAIPGIAEVAGERYRRTFELAGTAGVLEVAHDASRRRLAVHIWPSEARVLRAVSERVRRLFDLDADPAAIAAAFAGDRDLRPRLRRLPGVRIIGSFDGFETAVRTVLGQQVSVRGATTLAGRVAQRCCAPLPAGLDPEGTLRFLPLAPRHLAATPISGLGLTAMRVRALHALATAVAGGKLGLEPSGAELETRVRLAALPGFGPWTVEYLALRALADPDAFPAGDLGLRRVFAHPATGKLPSESALLRRAEEWRPWRGYAAQLLWQA